MITRCRAAGTAPCNPAEYCTGSDVDCPADVPAMAGMVCRAPTGPCDAPDTCNGRTQMCQPSNVNLLDGQACGTGGTCMGGTCSVPAALDIGDECTSNAACTSGNCGTMADGSRQCIGATQAGFGESCDGRDGLAPGDPSGTQCATDGPFLACCRGGTRAGTGQTGTCRECCGTGDPIAGCAGRDNFCCGGVCQDLFNDTENCGNCGYDCEDQTNACRPSVIACSEEDCIFSYACAPGEVCTDFDEACAETGLPYFCDRSGYDCGTSLTILAGSTCDTCVTDADCTRAGETCYSGCAVGSGARVELYGGWCTAGSYCALAPADCGVD
ncbi:MAG: hypothetical protein CMN30_12825 [Sandaracinus sp.]|nr:hypothetical protein [Sandaracinus sp.]